MSKTILINAGAGETRIAVVEDGLLQRFEFERAIGAGDDEHERRGGHSHIGEIILGRVQRVMAATEAAFVDIGLSRAGFLSVRDAAHLAPPDKRTNPSISDCVREGDTVLVQIIKDPIGDKGARLSASPSLPGRFLVLKPGAARVAFSRRLPEAEREKLSARMEHCLKSAKALPDAGYIVRTAAMEAAAEELCEDAENLAASWREIEAARENAKPPQTLHRDLSLVERVLRDENDPDIVLIDDAAAYALAAAYRERAMPQSGAKLEQYEGIDPLFEAMGIEDEVHRLSEPRVPLASGGWITVETTEAMTTVDVNSGSYTQGAGIEDMGFAVNREAADTIARQLRLRGIGGLIAIDFIDMASPDHATKLTEALNQAVARDRAPVRVLPPSEFGVVEMTRKRLGDPLHHLLTEPCGTGSCRGRQRTAATIACEALRRIEKSAAAAPGKEVLLFAAPAIVEWLEAHEDEVREGLARRGAPRVKFHSDAARGRDSFSVETR